MKDLKLDEHFRFWKCFTDSIRSKAFLKFGKSLSAEPSNSRSQPLSYNPHMHFLSQRKLLNLGVSLKEKRQSMEIPTCIRLHMNVVLVFIFFYFPSKSLVRCHQDVDYSGLDAIGSLPCSPKYLTQTYFEKHDTLFDSDFQGFLAHEHPLDSCEELQNMNSMLRLTVLQRDLVGEGSHRHLFSSIKLKIQPDVTSELPTHLCEVVVIDRLPSGVFADPFELQHLVQRGVFTDAAVFGDKNLELPSALSNRSVVEVHVDIGHYLLSKYKKGLEFSIELPVHARYPPLDGSGYSRVEMGMPDLFIRCSTKQKSQQNCVWMTKSEDIEIVTTDAVVWRIPSGNNAHSGIVEPSKLGPSRGCKYCPFGSF